MINQEAFTPTVEGESGAWTAFALMIVHVAMLVFVILAFGWMGFRVSNGTPATVIAMTALYRTYRSRRS